MSITPYMLLYALIFIMHIGDGIIPASWLNWGSRVSLGRWALGQIETSALSLLRAAIQSTRFDQDQVKIWTKTDCNIVKIRNILVHSSGKRVLLEVKFPP